MKRMRTEKGQQFLRRSTFTGVLHRSWRVFHWVNTSSVGGVVKMSVRLSNKIIPLYLPTSRSDCAMRPWCTLGDFSPSPARPELPTDATRWLSGSPSQSSLEHQVTRGDEGNGDKSGFHLCIAWGSPCPSRHAGALLRHVIPRTTLMELAWSVSHVNNIYCGSLKIGSYRKTKKGQFEVAWVFR